MNDNGRNINAAPQAAYGDARYSGAGGMRQNIRPSAPPNQQAAGQLQKPCNVSGFDEEKAVILVLIIILARNGADFVLIAALLYLLM